jgi:hypothetical protein
MPVRLIVVPIFLLLIAATAAVAAWVVEVPALPIQSPTHKMAMLEANVDDADLRWAKAKEIVDAEVAASEAQWRVLVSGMKVYRWSFAMVVLLCLVQVQLTYEWWRKASNTSFNPDAR